MEVIRWPFISWLDLNCVCSVFSLISFALHILLIVVLIVLLRKRNMELVGSIFGWLLIGLAISGLAEFLDFYHNLAVAMSGKMLFYHSLDIIQQILKGVGFGIIFLSLIYYFKEKFQTL